LPEGRLLDQPFFSFNYATGGRRVRDIKVLTFFLRFNVLGMGFPSVVKKSSNR
jgi:hypothetical protein